MSEHTIALLGDIEGFVEPEAVAERMGLTLETTEAEVAVAAVRGMLLAGFDRTIREDLEEHYLRKLYEQDRIEVKYGALNDELALIERALALPSVSEQRASLAESKTGLRGPVNIATYIKALEAEGLSSIRATNSWKEMVDLIGFRSRHGWSGVPPEGKAWPRLEGTLLPEDLGHMARIHLSITVDVQAFKEVSRFFNSFGEDYFSQLEAVNYVMPHAQATSKYHFFKIWERFAQYCGGDVHITARNVTEDKEHEPTVLASRQDFLEFADAKGISRNTAGRAWAALTSIFNVKVHPQIRKRGPVDLPVRFQTQPKAGEGRVWYESERKMLDGLDVEGLRELVGLIDSKTDGPATLQTVDSLVGGGVGPKIVQFWREFCKEKLGPADTTEPESGTPPATSRERLARLTSAKSIDEFNKLIADEPPFVIWVAENDDVDHVDTSYWQRHRTEFEALGLAGPMASRAIYRLRSQLEIHAIDRTFNNPTNRGFYERQGIDEAIRDEDDKIIALTVAKPTELFDALTGKKYIGLKSAQAVIMAAYFQREQYIAKHGHDIDITA